MPSPSGREERLANLVVRKVEAAGRKANTDSCGNVLVRLPGRDPALAPLILASHTDEIGMVVTGIDADGRQRVNRSGGLFPFKIGERPVTIAVDGCAIPPGLDLALDGRPVVWSKDAKTHYDQRLVRGLCDAAKAAGTELQIAALEAAFSDASTVYDSGAAPRVGIIGHCRDNSHGFEVAPVAVFDHLLATLQAFLRAGGQ